jgi:transposase
MTQPSIAAVMGISLSTVNRAHMAYDQGGIKALKPKPNGGRKHENMTLARKRPCWLALRRRRAPARC